MNWLVYAFRYNTINEKSIPVKDTEFSTELYFILGQKQRAYELAAEGVDGY